MVFMLKTAGGVEPGTWRDGRTTPGDAGLVYEICTVSVEIVLCVKHKCTIEVDYTYHKYNYAMHDLSKMLLLKA